MPSLASYRRKAVCDCSSYRFPHRAGGGKCEASVGLSYRRQLSNGTYENLKVTLPELCESCGQPSETTEVDFGIGSYEFWGSPGVDVNIQTVSCCCEAGMIDNTRRNADQHPEWFNNGKSDAS